MTKIEEIWKDVVGYEFYYQVSNHGNVRRVGGNIMRLSKQPKSDRPEDYYLLVTLTMGGIEKQYRVHRLVAQAFIPNPNNFNQVNHLDRVKHNNMAYNLEWSNSREQLSHTFTTRLKRSKYAGVTTGSYCKNRWRAQIQIACKKMTLGTFNTEEQARDAYLAALEKYNQKNKYATFK